MSLQSLTGLSIFSGPVRNTPGQVENEDFLVHFNDWGSVITHYFWGLSGQKTLILSNDPCSNIVPYHWLLYFLSKHVSGWNYAPNGASTFNC